MCIARTQIKVSVCIVSNVRSLFWAVEESFSIYIDWWMRRREKNTNSKVEKPSGLQIWHKEWYGYLIIQIHQPWSWPFSMLHFQSIDRSIYIYDIIPCLSLFRKKKNNTYFSFNKLTKKKCHLQHLFQPLSTWFLETMWLLPVWHAVLSRNL